MDVVVVGQQVDFVRRRNHYHARAKNQKTNEDLTRYSLSQLQEFVASGRSTSLRIVCVSIWNMYHTLYPSI